MAQKSRRPDRRKLSDINLYPPRAHARFTTNFPAARASLWGEILKERQRYSDDDVDETLQEKQTVTPVGRILILTSNS